METKQTTLLDNRAVSPVIGVILMVAITVILAALIAGFVVSGSLTPETAPTANLEIETQPNGLTEITHNGGDTLSGDEITVIGADVDEEFIPDEIRSGTIIAGLAEDNQIRVVWNGDSTSATLATHSTPQGFFQAPDPEPSEPEMETEWIDLDADEIEDEYLSLVDTYRNSNGLSELERNTDMDETSQETVDTWATGDTEEFANHECLHYGTTALMDASHPGLYEGIDDPTSNQEVAEALFLSAVDSEVGDPEDPDMFIETEGPDHGFGITIIDEDDEENVPGLYMSHGICRE